MKFTLRLLVLSLLITTDAIAGHVDPHAVTMMQIYGTPSQNFTDVFVSTCPASGTVITPCVSGTSCTNQTGFVLERSHPLFKEIYAAILSARHAGTEIGLQGSGSCMSIGMEVLAEVWFVQ